VRVLQLSTSKQGGAGISAAILDQKLREDGVESRLLTRSNIKSHQVILSKAVTFVGKVSASADYDFLSSNSTSTLDYQEVLNFNPQVIHIHNWYNLLSVSSFYKLSKIAPLMFTLHDERLVTGGCHVTLGCEKYLSECSNCPAHRLHFSRDKFKNELVSFFESGACYGIISPSQWLMNKIEQTPLAKKALVSRVIPNHLSIPTRILSAQEKKIETTQLIFVASNLDAPYKGLNLLIASMRILDAKLEQIGKKVDLIIVGNSMAEIVVAFKNIHLVVKSQMSTNELSQQVILADILVVPSLSENYPGVIAEAQLQGTRVVANRVGGVSEMIEDKLTGYLSSPNSDSLAEKLLEAILDTNREQVRIKAFQAVNLRQNSQVINQHHKEIYKELTNAKGK
jgi:glycosyltransferase involved in cell wall biosynthesis